MPVPTQRLKITGAGLALGGLALLVAGCVHYEPKPLVPAKTASALESRTLVDAGLRAFIEANAPDTAKEWPRRSWVLSGLALVAFYYHPSLDVARAQARLTAAGVVTAGGRPNPSVGFSTEYAQDSGAGVSPWILGLNFDIPIETAGKRGYRVALAKQLAEASRLEVAETGWKVRSGVRAALLELMSAQQEIELLQAETAARANVVHLMERRFAVGEISRPEVDAARTQWMQARVSSTAAEGRTQASRVALAGALGLPPPALDGAALVWPDLDALPDERTLPAAVVQTAGLLNRLDVRRALVEYAALERALQLEVARQYPDVHIQPGYTFDQGAHKFALGMGIELPLLNRNQGPIAEALARREKAAADFVALQAQVIGQLHQARAQYRAAFDEVKEIETSLIELQNRTEKLTQRAVELGEADRLALASVQLQRLVVTRAQFDARHRAQIALGALEDAMQRPLAPAAPQPEIPLTIHRPPEETK